MLHAPPFLLTVHWWITHSHLLSLQLQGDASSTSSTDILPPRLLLLIGIFSSLITFGHHHPHLSWPHSLSEALAVLAACSAHRAGETNSSISSSHWGKKIRSCTCAIVASTGHGRQALVPLSLVHKAQRLPVLLALHAGSAGFRLYTLKDF